MLFESKAQKGKKKKKNLKLIFPLCITQWHFATTAELSKGIAVAKLLVMLEGKPVGEV